MRTCWSWSVDKMFGPERCLFTNVRNEPCWLQHVNLDLAQPNLGRSHRSPVSSVRSSLHPGCTCKRDTMRDYRAVVPPFERVPAGLRLCMYLATIARARSFMA